MNRYAFYFDANSCSGCKACQIACKDKNNLPTGVLWRRVYETVGGGWTPSGDAWSNTVFAHNLSMACNHCVHPKCAGVCPVDAYHVRPDGIVLLNTQKCIRCEYCRWACPYDAPQVDASTRLVSKCDLCCDYLDNGLPPACVAACPMRCLELVEINEGQIYPGALALWTIPGEQHPVPLPRLSRTEPHLVIKPHHSIDQADGDACIANREETSPGRVPGNPQSEIPLMIFTLLTQMAIGAFLTLLLIFLLQGNDLAVIWAMNGSFLGVGVVLLGAVFASLFHLGKPMDAWRALSHLRKSWLSREILFLTAFGILWLVLFGMSLFQVGTISTWKVLAVIVVSCGLAELYCMQRVYQLRCIPAWNQARTLLEFALAGIVLGALLTCALLPARLLTGFMDGISLAVMLAFLVAGILTLSGRWDKNKILIKWRIGLLLAAALGAGTLVIWPTSVTLGFTWLILGIGLVEEFIGRWLFYARRNLGI
jgi:anaerobic dimethyl sulfoxide reductase subunit B (iron-sulfur subunit)